MKKIAELTNKGVVKKDSLQGRLEALVALTAGVLRVVAKDPKSKHVTGAEDRAVIALASSGMTQLEIAKLLGIDMNRVNKIGKNIRK